MSRIKVGVVRGGPSSEYDVSLKTGGAVLKYLPREKYEGLDVLLDKKGKWYLGGFPKEPADIFDSVDVVFNAFHGEFGEDGGAQQFFDSFNIPYTGSGAFVSAMAMKKHLAYDVFSRLGIKMPKGKIFSGDDFLGIDAEYAAEKVFNTISPPWVVKPSSVGSSVGVKICRDFSGLVDAIENAHEYGNFVLVEEYIEGREATCGVIDDYRGKKHYALPVVEIVPAYAEASAGKPPFFDYESKYGGFSQEICPANFESSVKRKIEEIALLAHEGLGCRHYSRADFIVSPRGIYFLELNTLPGLTSESLLPKAAAAGGLEFPALLDHLLKLALKKL